jgi:hypothetical protein
MEKGHKHFRLTLAAIIWPGPVDGPHPFTLFKILTPAFIIWIGVLPATFVMGLLAALLSLYFYEVIKLEGTSDLLNNWVHKLPDTFERALKLGTIPSLILLVLLAGPFPLAISFKFAKLRRFRAEALLILGSFANSLIWTGIVWGGGLSILRTFLDKVSLF